MKILSMPQAHVEASEYIDLWFQTEIHAHVARTKLIQGEIFDFEDDDAYCMIRQYRTNKTGWRIFDQETAIMAKLFL